MWGIVLLVIGVCGIAAMLWVIFIHPERMHEKNSAGNGQGNNEKKEQP